jgi:hypothetical protein
MAYDARARELHGERARLNFFEPSERSAKGVSLYKGVSWSKKSQKFEARIKHNGVMKYLGIHKSEVEAARAFDAAAKELRGPNVSPSSLNFPSEDFPSRDAGIMGEPLAARSLHVAGNAARQRQQHEERFGVSQPRRLSAPPGAPTLGVTLEGEEDYQQRPLVALNLSALPAAPKPGPEAERTAWPIFHGSSGEAAPTFQGAFPELHPFDLRSFSQSMSATSLHDHRLEAQHGRSANESVEDYALNLLAQISWASL